MQLGGGLRGLIIALLQVPKLRIQTVGEGGQLDATPCIIAGGERSEWAHFLSLSPERTSVNAIKRKNRNKGTVCTGGSGALGCQGKIQARASDVSPGHVTIPRIQWSTGRRGYLQG